MSHYIHKLYTVSGKYTLCTLVRKCKEIVRCLTGIGFVETIKFAFWYLELLDLRDLLEKDNTH